MKLFRCKSKVKRSKTYDREMAQNRCTLNWRRANGGTDAQCMKYVRQTYTNLVQTTMGDMINGFRILAGHNSTSEHGSDITVRGEGTFKNLFNSITYFIGLSCQKNHNNKTIT